MAIRYSKRSKQQIHWTNVGYNSVLQGLSYEQVRTKDAKVNTWITEGRARAERKQARLAKVIDRIHAAVVPKTGVIPASQLDPNNWTARHNIERQQAQEDAVPPEPKSGWSGVEIVQVIERLQSMVKDCPCCRSPGLLKTYDTMTYGIYCQNDDCRLKVERGIVNERGPRQCMQLVIAAWNNRPTVVTIVDEGKFGELMRAAREAADEMCGAATGTPTYELGSKLDDIVDELTP